jgi:homoserine O-acetyltransferase
MDIQRIAQSLEESGVQHLAIETPFRLESGVVLPRLEIAYHTYGRLNAAQGAESNVVWVCHALTGNSDAADWWSGLIGTGRLFDPDQYFIVCANMLGSCYGSSGALTLDIQTGEPYYLDFPAVTTRDMARAHALLRKHLGIGRIAVCLGGSMGGQQVIEWAIEEPDVFEAIIPIATNARHSPWGIAFNAAQRLALEADPTFHNRNSKAGKAGIKAARAMGIISYRSYDTFQATQLDDAKTTDNFRAESYQVYQGEKLADRFHAHSYWHLSKAMDSHNVGRVRTSVESALGRIAARTLVIGISTDLLFPPHEQQFLAEHIPNAEYVEIASLYGHDGFLIEFEAMTEVLEEFLCGVGWE